MLSLLTIPQSYRLRTSVTFPLHTLLYTPYTELLADEEVEVESGYLMNIELLRAELREGPYLEAGA